jgi:uncharacterized membrane protein SpoIIM required for sporulation
VAQAHAAVYSVRPKTVGGLLTVFGRRYRQAIRRTAPFILVMAALLVITVVATDLWIVHSRAAEAGLLPPAAREAIRRATGHRRSFDVAPSGVSTFILLNNVQVAFLAFALGIALGVGSAYLVVQNAVVLGALAGAFTVAGKSGPFWSLILPHGMLELTAICISAGAGARIGWSLVEPGDRPRSRALVEETRDAVIVIVGVIPAFVVAALIEGFLTGTSVPAPVNIGIGAGVVAAYLAFLFGLPPRVRRSRSTAAPWP